MSTATQLRGIELQTALVRRASRLPPISTSVVELTQICVAPDWEIGDACRVIDSDPLLLGAILREANSAVFGAASLAETSHDAVVRLGASRVMSISVEMGLEGLLGNNSPYGLAAVSVFRHSYIASVAAEVVKRFSPRSLPHVLPAAALMHDVGELVLSHHLSSATLNDLDAARTVGMSVVEAERRVLDIDHAEVSAIICRLWRFPDVIADGVRHHHAPWTSGDALSYAVALCDVIADVALGGSNRDVVDSLTVSRCLVELDISKVDFGGLVEHTTERLAKYGKQFV